MSNHERDVTLPIKGSAYICSGHLISVLEPGNFIVGWKMGLSQDLAAASNSKNAFLLFA